MPTNPTAYLRRLAGLTQEQLASKIKTAPSDRDSMLLDFTSTKDTISEQYLRRVEKGLLSPTTNLENVYDILYSVLKVRHTNEDRISFEDAIANLVNDYVETASEWDYPGKLEADRNAYYLITSVNHRDIWRLTGDWYNLERWFIRALLSGVDFSGEYKTFKEFRLRVSSALADALDEVGPVAVGSSLYSFCTSLKLHPYTVQRFESLHGIKNSAMAAGAAGWPNELATALTAVGINLETVSFAGKKGVLV